MIGTFILFYQCILQINNTMHKNLLHFSGNLQSCAKRLNNYPFIMEAKNLKVNLDFE